MKRKIGGLCLIFLTAAAVGQVLETQDLGSFLTESATMMESSTQSSLLRAVYAEQKSDPGLAFPLLTLTAQTVSIEVDYKRQEHQPPLVGLPPETGTNRVYTGAAFLESTHESRGLEVVILPSSASMQAISLSGTGNIETSSPARTEITHGVFLPQEREAPRTDVTGTVLMAGSDGSWTIEGAFILVIWNWNQTLIEADGSESTIVTGEHFSNQTRAPDGTILAQDVYAAIAYFFVENGTLTFNPNGLHTEFYVEDPTIDSSSLTFISDGELNEFKGNLTTQVSREGDSFVQLSIQEHVAVADPVLSGPDPFVEPETTVRTPLIEQLVPFSLIPLLFSGAWFGRRSIGFKVIRDAESMARLGLVRESSAWNTFWLGKGRRYRRLLEMQVVGAARSGDVELTKQQLASFVDVAPAFGEFALATAYAFSRQHDSAMASMKRCLTFNPDYLPGFLQVPGLEKEALGLLAPAMDGHA